MPEHGDALIVVDVQKDFLAGGALPVPGAGEILAPLNFCLDAFSERKLPIFVTRDWHPEGHCSFRERGGPWPRHCVAGTQGADFPEALRLPPAAAVISKGSEPKRDAYSGFDETNLEEQLLALQVRRVVIAGLATDYCVRATARDALQRGFSVAILLDAVRSVDYQTGQRALAELREQGATLTDSSKFIGEAATL